MSLFPNKLECLSMGIIFVCLRVGSGLSRVRMLKCQVRVECHNLFHLEGSNYVIVTSVKLFTKQPILAQAF
jgi:hypothetical protein